MPSARASSAAFSALPCMWATIVQNRLCKGETQYFEVRAETLGKSFRASFGGRARVLAGLYRSTRPKVRFEYGVSGTAWSEVAKTIRAFRDGSAPPADGQCGRDVLEVIAACYESDRLGKRLRLDSREVADLSGLAMGADPG